MATVKRSLNVAVVGMGSMGVPIARNLGFKGRGSLYLQLHSRSLERAKKVSSDLAIDGATCAMRLHSRYSTVTKWSDVVIAVLRDAEASRKALLEDNEALIRNARPGQIIVDHTTVDAETSRECHHEAMKRGAHFLEAPMGGSPRAAFNGQLALFVGGDDDVFQKVLPLFNMYAETTARLGGPGAGATGKGIAQMLTAIHSAAAAEAMKMAHIGGVENTRKLMAALDASGAGSPTLRRLSGDMEVLFRNPTNTAPTNAAAGVDRTLYDVSLLGSGCSEPIEGFPLLHRTVRALEAASRSGNGAKDLSVLAQYVGPFEDISSRISGGAMGAAAASAPSAEGDGSHHVGDIPVDENGEVEFY